jgi:hypothetical protein
MPGRCSSASSTFMSSPPDNRLIRIRSAAQDATDFGMSDEAVRRFIELRDAGQSVEQIAAALSVDPEVVAELVSADESYAVARRIASGELPMYPSPEPADRVVDRRAGSSWVPFAALVVILLGAIVYGLIR